MTEQQPEIELPRGVALAWGVAAHPQRGPKRELSIEGIVDAATAIADESGLGAVSMSSVAAALGFTTMSLYRYVSAKEDLLLLMQDQAIGLPSRAPLEAGPWRQGLTLWYRESLEIYAAHPWILDIDIIGLPSTPNNLVWMDCGLAILRDTPLTYQERVATVLALTGSARWESYINRGYESRAAQTGVSPSDRDIADAHIMSTLVTAELFPYLHEAIQSGVFTSDDNPFEYGLSRLLDGVEQYISSVATDPSRRLVEATTPPSAAYPKDERVRNARQARREAESKLREAIKREEEAVVRAREKERKAQEKEARTAEKRTKPGGSG
jgi:AcrR family transcriptional regulator